MSYRMPSIVEHWVVVVGVSPLESDDERRAISVVGLSSVEFKGMMEMMVSFFNSSMAESPPLSTDSARQVSESTLDSSARDGESRYSFVLSGRLDRYLYSLIGI